jgi:rhombotail lipoprotein
MPFRSLLRGFAVAGLALAMAGCSSWWLQDESGTRQGSSSSLVDYLYPNGEIPPDYEEQIPNLTLPLRVGLAFVPGDDRHGGTLGEAKRTELLELVKARFTDREYISHIEVIPETYLRSTRGFDGLQQVARLYAVDVMALVSYDQVAAMGDKKSSVLYWTIVGAYFVKGTENEVQTFVDTAVFDVATRKLLFRAPGTDTRDKSSTLAESSDVMRETRERSFEKSVVQMSENLAAELDRFEVRLEEEPDVARVAWEDGRQGGAGALLWLLPAVVLAGRARARRTAGSR